MPLKFGTLNIDSVYNGDIAISSIYKGTELVFESFRWLPYSFEYLFNSLIPSTIDGKSVKNKAQITKLYGNSVIENQCLSAYSNTSSGGGVNITWNSDGTITYSGLCNSTTTIGFISSSLVNSSVASIQGHKYLLNLNLVGSIGTGYFSCASLSYNFTSSGIYTASSGTFYGQFRCVSGENYNFTVKPNIIDLTQMFGTGREPTSMNDSRIKKLLKYFPKNTGTYKETTITEIESNSYNMFDGTIERGGLDSSGQPDSNSSYVRSSDYVSVVGGRTIVLEQTGFDFDIAGQGGAYSSGQRKIYQYDIDHNFIKSTSNTNTNGAFVNAYTIQLENNCAYIKVVYYNPRTQINISALKICVHYQGTRTGYADYVVSKTIALKYQGGGVGTAHDTMEITDTEYMFTKDIVDVDFSSTGTWTYDSSHTRFYSADVSIKYKTPADNQTIANMLCGKYQVLAQDTLFNGSQDKAISYSSSGRISIRDTSLNGDTSLISGSVLMQLATAQVIRIPKKRLGIYTLDSDKAIGDTIILSDIKTNTMNGYSVIDILSNLGTLSGTTITLTKALPSGTIIFYETENDVADMPNEIDIEAGGTLTSDSDVLPNVDTLIKCK